MTKGELIKAFEGLDDDAHITVAGIDETCELNIVGWKDKVTGADVHNEIKQLSEEIDRVATTTKFNETYLLSGSTTGKRSDANWAGSLSFSLQVGADNLASNRIAVNIYAITASALGVGVDDSLSANEIVTNRHYGVNDNGSIVKISGATIDVSGITDGDNATAFIKAGSILPIGTTSGSGTTGTTGGFISVKTTSTARSAIDNISAAVKLVSARRSQLGAVQNRLEHTIKNLDNVVENTTAAESQIRDTDMAAEMVQYSKNNILQQAGQAMLAQANQSNQGVLALLS